MIADRSCSLRRVFLLSAALGTLALCALSVHPTPAAAAPDQKLQGAELFATRGCTHCHGDNGEGTERGPALRDRRKRLAADRIREQILHGGQGMPAFEDILKPDEVDSLIAFLRAKKWTPVPAAPAKAPAGV